MTDWVRRALTRRVPHKTRAHKRQVIIIEPDEKLVLLVKFSLGMAICLTGLEVACLAFLKTWSSEIFAAITGLIGTVTGVLVGHRA